MGADLMLRNTSPAVVHCLERASECERLAESATSPEARDKFRRLADQWQSLADNRQYIERMETFMHRTEQEFCRDQSVRLLQLAKECPDPQTRDQLVMMANEWLERAQVKEKQAKSA